MKPNDIEHILGKCDFFKGLRQSDIRAIADICQVETYKAGETVYQQGELGQFLYIVAEGMIDLERTMKIGSRQASVVIAKVSKCGVFGCWSTLLDDAHNTMFTSICQKPSTIIVLKGADLRGLMTRDTRLGYSVVEKLCFLLRDRIEAAYGAMEKI